MMRKISLFLLWFAVWMALTWPPETRDVVSGALASAFVTFMTVGLISGTEERKTRTFGAFSFIMRIFWFIVYIFVFLWECLKANIDVAFRVLHPDVPIRPGTVKVKTHLTSDVGLTFLSSSITLTPGTTTIDIDKEAGIIYVHLLYVKDGYDASAMELPVVAKFEKILRRIFE